MVSKRLSVKQSHLLNQHRYILGKLVKTSDKNRKQILNNAPADLFKALNLIFKLLDNQNLKLTKVQEAKIKKHKRFIKTTSTLKPASIKSQLVQRGGALSAILSAVLPVVAKLLKSVF